MQLKILMKLQYFILIFEKLFEPFKEHFAIRKHNFKYLIHGNLAFQLQTIILIRFVNVEWNQYIDFILNNKITYIN